MNDSCSGKVPVNKVLKLQTVNWTQVDKYSAKLPRWHWSDNLCAEQYTVHVATEANIKWGQVHVCLVFSPVP